MISQERFFYLPSSCVDILNSSAGWTVYYKGREYTAKIKNAIILHVFDNGYAIVSGVIGPEEIEQFTETTGLTDIFKLSSVEAIGISDSYIGMELSEIFDKFPELAGQVQSGVDEEGNPIYKDIITRQPIWSGFQR